MSSIFACDLGLIRKTFSHNFFCCFVFRFREIFFNQHWRQMRASLILLFGKTKVFFGKDTARKKLRFCIRYLWKMKEKPANLNSWLCFSIKWKATCRNWAHLDEEKQFGLKSHLQACCTQPFILKGHTLGFHPQSQKLETACTTRETAPQERTV